MSAVVNASRGMLRRVIVSVTDRVLRIKRLAC